MSKYFFLLLFIFLSNTSFAQSINKLSISFIPMYEQQPLVLEEKLGKDSILIETFKCYISEIALFQGEKKVYEEGNSFHLLDAVDSSSLTLQLIIPDTIEFSTIQFNVGIDSLTNVSGAFGGDLDPTNGMYWTWQSGYINLKLEGTSPICPARHHRFQFHIGGYQEPFNTLQKVSFPFVENKIDSLSIYITIDELLKSRDLKIDYQLMSPNKQAVEMAKLFSSLFYMKK